MYEEEKGQPAVVNDLDSQQTCPYCNKPISPKDEQAGNVGMFMETQCYHTFHLSCFKAYAVKACLKYRRDGQNPIFEEPKCGACNVVVPELETRMIIGPDYEQVENQRM